MEKDPRPMWKATGTLHFRELTELDRKPRTVKVHGNNYADAESEAKIETTKKLGCAPSFSRFVIVTNLVLCANGRACSSKKLKGGSR